MKIRKLVVPILLLFVCFGCASKDTNTIRCVLEYPSEMKLEQIFTFKSGAVKNIKISIDSNLKETSDKNFDDTVSAMKEIVKTQNQFNGVNTALDIDKKTKKISEKITVDIHKYDLQSDELNLFADVKAKEITEDYIIEKFTEDNYKVYLNDTLVKKR